MASLSLPVAARGKNLNAIYSLLRIIDVASGLLYWRGSLITLLFPALGDSLPLRVPLTRGAEALLLSMSTHFRDWLRRIVRPLSAFNLLPITVMDALPCFRA